MAIIPVPICFAFFLGLSLAVANADTTQPDLKVFEGKWRVIFYERGGVRTYESEGGTVTVEGNNFSIERDDSLIRGTIEIDATKTPKTVDVKYENGSVFKGIYLLSDDVLVDCYAEPGQERPSEFTSKPNNRLIFHVRSQASPDSVEQPSDRYKGYAPPGMTPEEAAERRAKVFASPGLKKILRGNPEFYPMWGFPYPESLQRNELWTAEELLNYHRFFVGRWTGRVTNSDKLREVDANTILAPNGQCLVSTDTENGNPSEQSIYGYDPKRKKWVGLMYIPGFRAEVIVNNPPGKEPEPGHVFGSITDGAATDGTAVTTRGIWKIIDSNTYEIRLTDRIFGKERKPDVVYLFKRKTENSE